MTAPAPDSQPRPRILLAEDDTRLAGAYARRLEAEYLAVDVVGSVAAAREHDRRAAYACLVLDRLLPDGDVLDFVREIDHRATHPPIVLVSAVADQDDRVEGLRAGADDYVAKPVHLDELAARVTRLVDDSAALERMDVDRLELGAVSLDPRRLRVRIGEEILVLPMAQILILRALLLRPGRAVRTDQLLDLFGPCDGPAVTSAALPAHLDALGRAVDGHLVIERAPRNGYLVREAPDPDAEPDRRRRIIRRLRPI